MRQGEEPKSVWTPAGGLRMHARVFGEAAPGGPSVILVHGLVVSGRYMVPAAERLAHDRRVFVPDLPGFGLSESPPCVLDVAGLSGTLSAWMEGIGLERATLVGNSMGCQVITELAARHPERVERAVLQGPTMDPRRRACSDRSAGSCSTFRASPLRYCPSSSATWSRPARAGRGARSATPWRTG
jgi:2-hydroxy-6-oxonona-2,4-dienedioate hydrolase